MLTPEQLAHTSLAISLFSLAVAGGSFWYARAQHRKRVADEMPIFWCEREWIDDHHPGLVVMVRNRSSADLVIDEVRIVKPRGLKLIAHDDAGDWTNEGRWVITAELIARKAANHSDVCIIARAAGTEGQMQAGRMVYGDTARGSFILHRDASTAESFKRESSVSLRVSWSFRAAKSRKMTAQVYMQLPAAMNAAAAATKAAIS